MGPERFRGARSIELLRVRQVLNVVIPGMVRAWEEVVGGGLFEPRSSETLEAGFRGGPRELTSHNPPWRTSGIGHPGGHNRETDG